MAAGLNDQEFGSSSESRLVAQLPGMVQQKFDSETMVLVFMVVFGACFLDVENRRKVCKGTCERRVSCGNYHGGSSSSSTLCGTHVRKKVPCVPTLPWLDACRQYQASGSVCSLLPRESVSA